MDRLCSAEQEGSVGIIRMHNGKVNAFSHQLIDELQEQFDVFAQQSDVKAVVMTGKEGIFSAGFDLKVMTKSREAAMELVKAGGELLTKLYLYPKPLIIACSGHAMAMGAISLFAADVRLGAKGDFKIGLNETTIGMALPHLAVAMGKDRLSLAHQTRAMVMGEIFSPEGAVQAGYLDEAVKPEELMATAIAYGKSLGDAVKPEAFLANKKRLRTHTLQAVEGIWD